MFEMIFNRKWESAHRFIEGENKGTLCTQPHGHTWRVEVTLQATQPVALNSSTNTVVLFSKAKSKWHKWIDESIDHSFFFNSNDPLLKFMLEENAGGRHVVVPGDPTTELMAVLFKSKLEAFLKEENLPLICSRLKIQETETNAIAFSGNTDEHLPSLDQTGVVPWWKRPDFSTNDL